jgi:hypothetical protein
MHEITGRDHVLLMEGHPLSGMGNWHRLGEVVDWDDELQHGLAHEDIRRVLGVGEWEIQTVGLADLRHQRVPVNAEILDNRYDIAADLLRSAGYLVLNGDATIDGHVGIACGDQPPHYFPTTTYGVLQNRTLLDLADIFIEAGKIERDVTLPILSAGTLRDRRLAFVSVGLPDDDALDGMVAKGSALNLGTSHDGSCALIGCLAPYIVVCGNTFRASLLGTAPQEVKVKHTSAIEDLSEAREILRAMISANDATDIAIQRLLNTSYPVNTFYNDLQDTVLPAVYTAPDDGKGWTGQHTRMQNRLDEVWECFYGDGVPATVRGTAWGALMGIQGWEQHHRGLRTTEGKTARNRAAVAIQRTVESRAGTGYPLADAFMRTPLPGLANVVGTDEAGNTHTLASLMAVS